MRCGHFWRETRIMSTRLLFSNWLIVRKEIRLECSLFWVIGSVSSLCHTTIELKTSNWLRMRRKRKNWTFPLSSHNQFEWVLSPSDDLIYSSDKSPKSLASRIFGDFWTNSQNIQNMLHFTSHNKCQRIALYKSNERKFVGTTWFAQTLFVRRFWIRIWLGFCHQFVTKLFSAHMILRWDNMRVDAITTNDYPL